MGEAERDLEVCVCACVCVCVCVSWHIEERRGVPARGGGCRRVALSLVCLDALACVAAAVVCAILLVSGAVALLQALLRVVFVCLDALACVAVVFAALLLSGGMLWQALLQVMLLGLLARCGGIGRGGFCVCVFGGRRGTSGA